MTLSWSMDKLGPICRSVEDCALVLDAIYLAYAVRIVTRYSDIEEIFLAFYGSR